MKITVAGAGAGKTTKLADQVNSFIVPEGKIVFVVAFTNAAVARITSKIQENNCGRVPDNIRISTIHSFFYNELIRPFYYYLFGKEYEKISTINLPNNDSYKNSKIKELELENLLHQTEIPERAKWVVYKKSSDTASTKEKRKRVLGFLRTYCFGVFVDEAQDMDQNMRDVFSSLDEADVPIVLFGDPKQDVKGFSCFQSLIEKCKDITYENETFRCPKKHLMLSNILASEKEKQFASAKNKKGSVNIIFESDVPDLKSKIEKEKYGLAYIQKKNDRFRTHGTNLDESRVESIQFEIKKAIEAKHGERLSELELNRLSYKFSESIVDKTKNGAEINVILKSLIKENVFDYDNKLWARIHELIEKEKTRNEGTILVQSIESIKGLEDEKCLFILTGELAPYFFGKKNSDNKTKHLLYVALTRSLDSLSILITSEVEEKYGYDYCADYVKGLVDKKD